MVGVGATNGCTDVGGIVDVDTLEGISGNVTNGSGFVKPSQSVSGKLAPGDRIRILGSLKVSDSLDWQHDVQRMLGSSNMLVVEARCFGIHACRNVPHTLSASWWQALYDVKGWTVRYDVISASATATTAGASTSHATTTSSLPPIRVCAE